MRLYIEGPAGALFDFNDEDKTAFAPTDRTERDQILSILASALGVIAGVTQQSSFGAKASQPDQPIQATSQCHDDRRSGVVLHLVARPDAEVGSTTRGASLLLPVGR
jgi:hypothetical protein